MMLLMLCGAMNNICTVFLLPLCIMLSFVVAYSAVKENDSNICFYILLILTLQNFLIGVGASIFDNSSESIKLFTQIPFIFTLITYICTLFRKKERINHRRKWFILFLLTIAFSFVSGLGSIQAIVVNIRNMITFYLAFEIGKYFLDEKEKIDRFFNKYNILMKFVLYIGIILLIGGAELYEIIGIDKVYLAKGSLMTKGTLPGRFYTNLFSKTFVRLGSLYYEPVNLAYFFVGPILYNIFYKTENKKFNEMRIINIIESVIGLALTFGKGGYLVIGMVFAYLVLYKINIIFFAVIKKKSIRNISIALILILACVMSTKYFKSISAASAPHFWGIIGTFNSVKQRPYGYGIGKGGNMAAVFNEDSNISFSASSKWLTSGGESAIMSFMYQLGIQGIIAMILLLLSLRKTKKGNINFLNIFSVMPVIVFIVGVFQENTFTPQCIIPIMLIQGCCYNMNNKDKINEGEERDKA